MPGATAVNICCQIEHNFLKATFLFAIAMCIPLQTPLQNSALDAAFLSRFVNRPQIN